MMKEFLFKIEGTGPSKIERGMNVMNREPETEVLVVGAGPVGMLTALLLSESGVRVRIIDKEQRTTAHSYACALHSSTLGLLGRLGLAGEAIEKGRRIKTLAFFDGEARKAELRLSELSGGFPYLLILPQSALENLFENELKNRHGIQVEWNHRLSSLEPQKDGVLAEIDKLHESSKGYIVRDFDWEVQKTIRTHAAFVVGADGYDSVVRQSLGIDFEHVSGPETFAIYELESFGHNDEEARIAIDGEMTNMFWPLGGNRCRWTLQVVGGDSLEETHSKDRTDVVVVEQSVDVKTLESVQRQIRERAPWFEGSVTELDWSVDVQFESRFVKRFGEGRCWLAGDAAHQALPFGMQSVNVGLREGVVLSGILAKILRGHGGVDLLEAYDHDRREEWSQLLGVGHELRPRKAASSWVTDRASQILPCVPASGGDLKQLVDQLQLDVV